MKRASTFGVLLVSALTAYPHPARLGARNLIDADACGALFKLPLADYSIEEGGDDSCIKRYRAQNLYVSVDAGGVSPPTPRSYNPALGFRGYPRFRWKRVVINGQKGFVATYINSEAVNQIGGLTYWATLDLPRAGKSVGYFQMHVATRNRNGLKDAQAIFESITFSKEHSNRGQKTRIKLRRQHNEISRDTADLQKGDGND